MIFVSGKISLNFVLVQNKKRERERDNLFDQNHVIFNI